MTPIDPVPRTRQGLLAGFALLLLSGAAPIAAQIRASERASVSQTIDGTLISLDYARPRLRGRWPIFGKVVHWDEVWTPGANWATTLKTSKPIELQGHPVPEGKYSVWLVVRQAGPWTLVLDPDHQRYHMNPPDSSAAQIRLAVAPRTAPRSEVLTWWFPELRVSGGTLALRWAETQVSLDLKVRPSFSIAMAREDAAPFLGRYSFSWVPAAGQQPDTSELVLSYEQGSLYGHYVPRDPYMGRFVLVRLGDGSLIPGLFDDKGEIYEVIREMVFEFKGPRDRPDRYEVRDDDDDLIAAGTRRP